jgi:FAD/FMN-containing dehydrogenase
VNRASERSPATAAASDDLAAALAAVVGERHVVGDPDLRASYETDWTGRFSGRARLVVRPGDAGEVAGVLRACAEAGAPVVTQGGNTGLVGGSVPSSGEVLLSTARVDGLEPADSTARQVSAGAGVTLAALQTQLRGSGLAFGVDHAARETATLGGMAATNAGGARAVRYGVMRHHVIGVEAVLADGRVVDRMAGLVKDNAGYDLPGLLVGSEGTLGVITRLRLGLVPELTARATALFGLPDTERALDLLSHLRGRLETLEAAEVMYADGIELVGRHAQARSPFEDAHPVQLLVECASREDPLDELAAAAEEAPAASDVAVAQDAEQRARLWALREGHTEAVNAAGVPHKLDVSLPLGRLAEFEARVRGSVADAAGGARTVLFGHLGDGNLHVNVLGPERGDERADEAVLELVSECGGSISAEHGVGRAKRRWLGLTRSPDEIAAMTALKRALDPQGLLNPGVLLPG